MGTMNIGEVAQRAGLSVKTVRYYSDLGLVPEAARTASGYRRYDGAAVVRLEFVRTLRELGLDLATIRRVLEREQDLPSVAAAHAEAIGAQIRLLRLQRAALRNLARRTHTPQEVERMNRLAQATADERRRLMNEFLDSIFAGVAVSSEFEARMRQAMPELPDDPTDEQVDAWIELAELVRDEDFRDRLRAMGQGSFGTSDRPARPPATPTDASAMTTAALVAERGEAARAAGIDPASPGRRPDPRRAGGRVRRRRSAARPTRSTGAICSTRSASATSRGPSGTGSCSPRSTAGRRSRPPWATGPGSSTPSPPASDPPVSQPAVRRGGSPAVALID